MLLLDSEALSSLAHGPQRRRDDIRSLIAVMRSRDRPVATVAAVLAEVVRGRRQDAAVFSGLRRARVEVHPVDARVGVRAGQLLGAARADSTMAVDAFLVAIGDVLGGAAIATTDGDDLRRLAEHATKVDVIDLDR